MHMYGHIITCFEFIFITFDAESETIPFQCRFSEFLICTLSI